MFACSMRGSVAQDCGFSTTVTSILPGRSGASNTSVWRIRSFGTSSRYSPPNVCEPPVHKFVKAIRRRPPTCASSACTVQVKPYGGSQRTIASGSRKAR